MAHNPRLADKQGLDEKSRKEIDSLHIEEDKLINEIEKLSFPKDNQIAKSLYNRWFNIEKQLQKLWKFSDNENYIRFWDFPQCSCAKSHNNEKYPHGNYIINTNCIFHG